MEENKNKQQIKENKEPTGNPEFNESMPDSKVDEIAAESKATVDDNIEKAKEVSNADQQDVMQGSPGEKPKAKRIEDYMGIPSVLDGAPSGITLMSRNITQESAPGISVNDIDKYAKNSDKAQKEFDRVESQILREGTRAVELGENHVEIKGTPAIDSVYPLESEITTETVSGKNIRIPHTNPRSREHGTILFSKDGIAKFADTIVNQKADQTDPLTTKLNSQASLKNLPEDVVLLNTLDNFGNIHPSFRHIRKGLFIIKGMNPIKKASEVTKIDDEHNSTERVIGYVNRNKSDGSSQLVPVLEANHEFFRVQEITPVVEDIMSATESLANEIVANQTRMAFGKYEQIQVAMSRVREAFSDTKNTLNWPEFANEDRSTLTVMEEGIYSIKGLDVSCHNSYKGYAALMHEFAQSEILHTMMRVNIHNIKDTLKFYRGMEGKNSSYQYFREDFKGDPNKTMDYEFPTMSDYGLTLASRRVHDNLAKWIYGFPALWRLMDEAVSSLDDSALKVNLLSKIKVNQSVVEDLVDSLGIGRLVDKDGVTSAEIIKKSDIINIVIGFNPNDLIAYSPIDTTKMYLTTSDKQTVILSKPYPAAGYINVRTKETQSGSSARYEVIPTWLRAIIDVVNNTEYIQRKFFVKDSQSGTQDKAWNFFSESTNYMPWRWNHESFTWLDLFIAEGIATIDSAIMRFDGPRNGYLRFLSFLEDANLVELFYYGESISISDVTDKILNNTQLWLKPSLRSAKDFPVLWDSAQKKLNKEPFEHQTHTLSNVNSRYGTNGTMLVFAPNRADLIVNSLTDMQMHDVRGDGSVKLESVVDIIRLSSQHNSLKNDQQFILVPTDEDEEFIVFWTKSVGSNQASRWPLTFRRSLSADGASGKRFLQLTEGADPSYLGYETDPTDLLFGQDDHQLIDGAQGYILKVKKGYSLGENIADDITNVPPYGWIFSLSPFYWSDDAPQHDSSGNYKLDSSNKAPLLYFKGSGRNLLYEKVGSDGRKLITYSRFRSAKTNDELDKQLFEADSVRRTAIPSMYGYKHKLYRGLLDNVITSGEVKNGYAENFDYILKAHASHKSQIHSEKAGAGEGLTSFHARVFYPETIDHANLYGTEFSALDAAQITEMFSVVNIEPSDVRFYDQQKTKYYNEPNIDVSLADNISTLHTLFAFSNMAAAVSVITDIEQFHRLTELDVYHASGDVNVIATPGVLYIDMYENLQDFIRRHQPNFYSLIFPSNLLLVARKDTLGVDKASVFQTVASDLFINSIMRSRFYINDYRDYVWQRPIIHLNDKWFRSQIVRSAFAEKFYLNKQ